MDTLCKRKTSLNSAHILPMVHQNTYIEAAKREDQIPVTYLSASRMGYYLPIPGKLHRRGVAETRSHSERTVNELDDDDGNKLKCKNDGRTARWLPPIVTRYLGTCTNDDQRGRRPLLRAHHECEGRTSAWVIIPAFFRSMLL